jgi:Trk K+ transport system NAD-binding subunit
VKKITFWDHLRYRFDNFMSRGTIALVLALFAVTLFMILAAALVIAVARLQTAGDTGPLGFGEALWQATMRTIDTGTVAGDTGWSFRGVAFVITLGGIFITSALIGVLANGLDGRLSELQRGRSRVVESGHTVILGWSPQVFTIVSELAYANHNLPRRRKSPAAGQDGARSACVAILADKDKVEMEEEIRIKVPNLSGTRVVCRSGDPLDLDDLAIVSPDTARAIIIVSPGGQYPDLPVAKTMLALGRDRERRGSGYHIVTAIHRPTNIEIARMIGGAEAQVFMVDRLIAFVIAQTCRQPGLSVVYSELFSFEGAAMYFLEQPALVGATYGEALFRCERAAPIGLRFQDGSVQLNPPMDTVIQAGDQLIAIAASEDSIQLSSQPEATIHWTAIQDVQSPVVVLERLLILGWNRRGPMILEQLSQYVPDGSQGRVVAPLDPEQMQADCAGVILDHLQVTFERGNYTDRAILEKLSAEGYQYIIILNPMETVDIQIADATTIIPLLHLRDIARKTGQTFSIVSEILDVRNRDLAEVTSAEDVIISERLIAMALTQLAENEGILPVFIDLLTPGGPEIYLKPAGDYVAPGQAINFYTILAAAQRKGETAIGYRSLAEASDPEKSFGVHLKPEKAETIVLNEGDRVIVLARD